MKRLSDLLGGVIPDVEKMVAEQTEPFIERLDTIISELREIKVLLDGSGGRPPVRSDDRESAQPPPLYPHLSPNDP